TDRIGRHELRWVLYLPEDLQLSAQQCRGQQASSVNLYCLAYRPTRGALRGCCRWPRSSESSMIVLSLVRSVAGPRKVMVLAFLSIIRTWLRRPLTRPKRIFTSLNIG